MKAGFAALALLIGCVGPTIRNPHEGQLKLTFHNEAGGPVCALFIFPFGQTEQGANWLPPDTEVSAGGWIAFWVPADTYQFHAAGCPYERQRISGYVASVIMNADGVVVLYKETDPHSKEAAESLAHSNTNSTLIPAKFTFVATPTPRPATVRSAPRSRGGR